MVGHIIGTHAIVATATDYGGVDDCALRMESPQHSRSPVLKLGVFFLA